MKEREYQICNRCVMDTSVKDITFDDQGICNYCTNFLKDSDNVLKIEPEVQNARLNLLIRSIKKQGVGRAYDCIIGVSGGVDSSWALVEAVKLGLRPLAVHMDNGWNSELAQNNIANLVNTLQVDLYTHVIDWQEYKKLMQAFFDSDVVDVELLYDNAMFAVNYRKAAEYGVKFIMSGMNTTSEGMPMPKNWNWHKYDKKNIVGIGKKFGNVKIKTFPSINTIDYVKFKFVKNIQWVPFLDFFQYNKIEAMKLLESEYGYKPYPYKHYESIFTRFYQGYILPKKFKIDKRRVHLSSLIISGQMTREDALHDIDKLPYPSDHALEEDKKYFLKKMGWTTKQLEEYIARPAVHHNNYPSEKPLWDSILISGENRYLYNKTKSVYKYLSSVIRKFKKHEDFSKLQ